MWGPELDPRTEKDIGRKYGNVDKVYSFSWLYCTNVNFLLLIIVVQLFTMLILGEASKGIIETLYFMQLFSKLNYFRN